jgi:uncharacterized damage-inducible protein DinB
MFSYQKKYNKYKNKYLILKELIGGQNKFKCNLTNRTIGNLCNEDETGIFDKIEDCDTKCLEEKLNEEFCAWKKLFEWSSETFKDIKFYCKGGSALALLVLKTILDKDKSKYDDFLKLNLIKDWDFTVIMTEEQQERIIKKAEELGIENQGEQLVILRFKKGLLLETDYLLELSIKTTQELYDLELPLTNLKFEVNSDNIDLFFEIVKMYVKKEENLDKISEILSTLLKTIQVNKVDKVHSIENGFYKITNPKNISKANLNTKLLNLMNQIQYNKDKDKIDQLTIKQFLITHIYQPDRLFIRFLGKNIIKSQKITRFYQENEINLPEWLINNSVLEEIKKKIYNFLKLLNEYIESAITEPHNNDTLEIKKSINCFLTHMHLLFENVNLTRIKITSDNIKLIQYLIPLKFFQNLKKKSIEIRIKNRLDSLSSSKGMELFQKNKMSDEDKKILTSKQGKEFLKSDVGQKLIPNEEERQLILSSEEVVFNNIDLTIYISFNNLLLEKSKYKQFLLYILSNIEI